MNGYVRTTSWNQISRVESRLRNLGCPIDFINEDILNKWARLYRIPNIDKDGIGRSSWEHLNAIFGNDMEFLTDPV